MARSLCEAKEGSLKERKALSRYIGRGRWIRGVKELKVKKKKKTQGRWAGGDRRDGNLSTGWVGRLGGLEGWAIAMSLPLAKRKSGLQLQESLHSERKSRLGTSNSHLFLTSSDPLGLIVSGAFGYCFVSAHSLDGLRHTDKVQPRSFLALGPGTFPADTEASDRAGLPGAPMHGVA